MATDDPVTQTTVNNLINEVGQLGLDVSSVIDLMIDPMVEVAGNWYGDLGDAVSGFIDDVDGEVFELLENERVAMNNIIDSVGDSLSNITETVLDKTNTAIEESLTTTVDIANTVTDNIDTLIVDAGESLTDVVDEVEIFIESSNDSVSEYLTDTFEIVTTEIGVLLTDAGETFDTLKTDAGDFIDNVLVTGVAVVDGLEAGIGDFTDGVINNIGGSVRDLLETISDLPAELQSLKSELVDSASVNIGDPLKALAGDFVTQLAIGLKDANTDDVWGLSKVVKSTVESAKLGISKPDEFLGAIYNHMPNHPILKAIGVSLLYPKIAGSMYSGIAKAESEQLKHVWSQNNAYVKLPVIDLLTAWRRDLIDDTKLHYDIKAQGIGQEDIETLKQSTRRIANEQDLIIFWLRGLIDDAHLVSEFSALGYSDTDIEHIKTSAHFIPPVQDLITMAVREVFTPDVAARFGQFEDFPPEFADWSNKQGVSEEWAKNYWAAHWALPSLQMGFEMLHRGTIQTQDLELLMRSQDIMPFWRDKLIDISFSPYTRVDIRRMHKVGVLDESDVNKAYHEIGYNDEKAKTLTDFTIALNAAPEDDVVDDISKLQIAQALELLKDGVINSFDAKQVLTAYGIDSDLADALITGVEIDLERQRRKDASNNIVEQSITGQISFDIAQDKLQNEGLTQHEINAAILKINRSDSVKPKIPSKADMDKFITAGLIDSTVYLQALGRLGYSEQWSNLYLKLLAVK